MSDSTPPKGGVKKPTGKGSGVLRKLTEVVEGDIVFLPSPAQRKAKAAFWAVWNDMPFADIGSITETQVSQVTHSPAVRRWWTDPQFREWFLNKDEFRQRVEYLVHLALDTAEDILLDPEANANARVQMVKLLAELSSKMPQRWSKEVVLDSDVQRMDQDQLRAFIEKHTKLLGSGG